MFTRKRIKELKNGEVSVTYQAIVMVRRGDKKVRKAISLGEFSNPYEALNQEIKFLHRMQQSVDYPVDQYREIRHSAKYNRPMVVTVPIKIAKKRRKAFVKSLEKQKLRVAELERLVSDLDRK